MSMSQFVPLHDVVTREREWCASVVDAYGVSGVVLSESTIDLVALRVITHAAATSEWAWRQA